jgi:hypothetical protein
VYEEYNKYPLFCINLKAALYARIYIIIDIIQ